MLIDPAEDGQISLTIAVTASASHAQEKGELYLLFEIASLEVKRSIGIDTSSDMDAPNGHGVSLEIFKLQVNPSQERADLPSSRGGRKHYPS